MNLRGIVSVSGKPGLFKLIGQNKAGFVLETLDSQKVKSVVNLSTTKMAALEDITVFGLEDDIRLIDILEQIKTVGKAPDTKGAKNAELRDFFREVAPTHDEERVYISDIKKIISWYGILKELPLFNEEAPAEEEATSEEDNASASQGA